MHNKIKTLTDSVFNLFDMITDNIKFEKM